MILPGNLRILLTAGFTLLLCVSAATAAVFVDCNAPSGGDGLTWATAFQRVQNGLDAASDSNSEVWVATGTYAENVILRAGRHLYGGFIGTEADRFERSPAANETIIDGGQVGSVVNGANNAVMDGFTITNGKSNGSGVYCSYVSPTISNCRITGNKGSGVYCYQSSPTIVDCEITENTDKGVYCYIGGNASIIGCTIANNSAVQYAGIFCNSASPTIKRCVVTGNEATGASARGGGISFLSSGPTASVENCLIAENSAPMEAGVYCSMSSPSFTNCTIAANSAASTGGNIYLVTSSPAFRNTIVAFGTSPIGGGAYKNAASNPSFVYSDFWQNGAQPFDPIAWDPSAGNENLTKDPLFVQMALSNYHLLPISGCIDKGTDVSAPTDDLDGVLRPQGGGFDVGAYEYGPAPSFDSIVEIKRECDGERVGISNVVISTAFDGFFYIEQQDRVAGIRVAWEGSVPTNHAVSVSGFLETRNGVERQIRADKVTVGDPAGLDPLGMGPRSLVGADFEYHAGPPASGQIGKTGVGPNNVGLLVRVWGRVIPTAVSGVDAVIYDGSDSIVLDLPPEITAPPVDRFVRITGICSIGPAGSGVASLILVRNDSDIILLD